MKTTKLKPQLKTPLLNGVIYTEVEVYEEASQTPMTSISAETANGLQLYIFNIQALHMRDINNNQLLLHSVTWFEPNLQMPLRYDIYLF